MTIKQVYLATGDPIKEDTPRHHADPKYGKVAILEAEVHDGIVSMAMNLYGDSAGVCVSVRATSQDLADTTWKKCKESAMLLRKVMYGY